MAVVSDFKRGFRFTSTSVQSTGASSESQTQLSGVVRNRKRANFVRVPSSVRGQASNVDIFGNPIFEGKG